MTLTLWRGEQKLGELRPRAEPRVRSNRPGRRPPSLSAFLIRGADAPPCEGIRQVRVPFPGAGVQQYRVEPDIVAQRRQRSAPRVDVQAVELSPASAEEAKGVGPARQLTVRDGAGKVYLPRAVFVLESRYEPEHYADALREAPPEALVDGVVWTVLVVFASQRHAPELSER